MLSVNPLHFDVDTALAHYAEHGYARLGPLLGEEGLTALRERADALMLGQVSYPGLFFQLDAPTGRYEDAPLGLGWQGPSLDYRKLEKLELDPLFRAWLENPLFERIARARIPGDIVLYRSILFHKGQAGGSNLPWHQDGGKLWGITQEPELQIWTALDDAPEEGGCLEVVPGTHRQGLVTPLGGVIPPDQVAARQAEAHRVLLPVRAGEVLLVHNHVWHRSGRGRPGQRRRAFSVCYMSASTRCVRKKKAPRVFPPVFRQALGTNDGRSDKAD
ncbi:Ectoine hydroxylase-related dioxygenase, phytanoyl-CoA dioxygenase (PhyH) family [Stigmatella erecta]|uniref:Ectoine hydroxylase-related dioxygenase, phytanoyl-CoA dioxygenase (PhyH) family n=1 Tax=Stigmatella erecta TaxID=83460 RepID=A0A1H9ZL78_9BACT|nr:phytanoyl-CoA dioxygenase family protein [Stigmatella erecta]SES82380.1 Ectoine hydroxylase-related dioxygenase, phytanoyl-CoA dioxygenase (PhyH) family [Stigmatella erecta]